MPLGVGTFSLVEATSDTVGLGVTQLTSSGIPSQKPALQFYFVRLQS